MLNVLPKLNLKFDMIFCDPPFNLAKKYKSKINDSVSCNEYLQFQFDWIKTCYENLKEGGALFIFNLPKWNIEAGHQAMEIGLEFRNWIAIDMTLGMPIRNRLYPSHYSLLYLTKGKPRVFNSLRTPIAKCRHCDGDIKDYGGHRNKIHVDGLNLKDVWADIGKVSGNKNRDANELPIKLIKRAIEISTKPGDLILDPFAGSGTSIQAAIELNRRIVGIELDDCNDIQNRLNKLKNAA